MYTVWAEWEGGGLGRGIGVVEGSEETWEREEAKRVRPLYHFNPQNFPHSSERKKRFYFVNTTVVTDPFEIVIGSSSVHSPSLTHSRSRASEVS